MPFSDKAFQLMADVEEYLHADFGSILGSRAYKWNVGLIRCKCSTLLYFFYGLAFEGLGLAAYLQLRRDGDSPFKKELIEKFPVLRGLMGHMLISVNHEYVFDDAIVPEDAEVALFPPVSGG